MKNLSTYILMVAFAIGFFLEPMPKASAENSSVQRYVFDITPRKMQGITMTEQSKLHDLHVEAIMEQDKDCTVCHFDNDEINFMGLAINNSDMTSKQKAKFIHQSCNNCHVEMQSGARRKDCQTCHSPTYAPEGEEISNTNTYEENSGEKRRKHHKH